jgi:hypothetical protein
MHYPMMKPTLITATIIYIIILLPALIFAPLAAFLYDDPSATGTLLHMFSLFWFTFPATIIASIIGGWTTFKREKISLTRLFLCLPIIHATLLALFGVLHFVA